MHRYDEEFFTCSNILGYAFYRGHVAARDVLVEMLENLGRYVWGPEEIAAWLRSDEARAGADPWVINRRNLLSQYDGVGVRIVVPSFRHFSSDPCGIHYQNREQARADLHRWIRDYDKNRSQWMRDSAERMTCMLDRVTEQAVRAGYKRGSELYCITPFEVKLIAAEVARHVQQDALGDWYLAHQFQDYEIGYLRPPLELLTLRCASKPRYDRVWAAYWEAVSNGIDTDGVIPPGYQQVGYTEPMRGGGTAEWLRTMEPVWAAREAVKNETLRIAAASGMIIAYESLLAEGFSPRVIQYQLGRPNHYLDDTRYWDAQRVVAFRAHADRTSTSGKTPSITTTALRRAGWSTDLMRSLLGTPPLLRGSKPMYYNHYVAAVMATPAFAAVAASKRAHRGKDFVERTNEELRLALLTGKRARVRVTNEKPIPC